MKKITLLAFSIAVSSFTYAQTTLIDIYGESNPDVFIQPTANLDPCNQSVASNSLENGGLFGDQLLAVDIDVDAGSTFLIEEVIPTFVGDASSSSLIFHFDNGGIPGDEIATVTLTETDNVITGSNFGFDFHQISYSLDTPYLIEGGTVGVKIWMQVVSDSDGWESTTVSNTGLDGAFNNDSTGGEWVMGTDGTDYVYELNGQCDVLGVTENIANLVSIYPNPASDVLNVDLASSVEVSEVAMYDVLGKEVGVSYINGKINISGLTSGVYVLKVNTNGGTLTQKIVKK